MSDFAERFKKETSENDVVVYMKGTQQMPQCGFSAAVVAIFQRLGVNFHDVNMLANPELRQPLNEFADWPTLPKVFVKGEFIGGCDITREMYESGELEQLLKDKGVLKAA